MCEIGNPTQDLLIRLNLTPSKLGWLTGFANSAIYDLRSGRLKRPPKRFLREISKYGIDPKEFEKAYAAFREKKGAEVRSITQSYVKLLDLFPDRDNGKEKGGKKQ